MEFEKNTAKFSFGAGTVKTAGAGKLSDSVPVPKSSPDKKKIAKTAAVAASATALFLIKRKAKRK